MAVARTLSDNEFQCIVVEKETSLGGHVKKWACTATEKCVSCYCCIVDDLIQSVRSSDKISVELGWQPVEVIKNGTKIEKVILRSLQNGSEKSVDACAVVMAIGFRSFDPTEKVFWGYGRLDGVVTLAELNQWLQAGNMESFVSDESKPIRIAFLQCVGSRDASINANYCSEYCCGAALRMAVNLCHDHPSWDITIFYIDLQIAGKMARALMEAANRQGIHFVQGVPGEIVQTPDAKLGLVTTRNGLNQREEFDKIVLSTGLRPASDSESLAKILGLELDQFGFIAGRATLPLGRTVSPGVYVAGTCTGPANIQKSLLSAVNAAAAIIADYSTL